MHLLYYRIFQQTCQAFFGKSYEMTFFVGWVVVAAGAAIGEISLGSLTLTIGKFKIGTGGVLGRLVRGRTMEPFFQMDIWGADFFVAPAAQMGALLPNPRKGDPLKRVSP